MSKPKLTPWFPAYVKPVRKGVYRTRFVGDAGGGFSLWTGLFWGPERSTKSEAAKPNRCGYQDKQWCGLAVKP